MQALTAALLACEMIKHGALGHNRQVLRPACLASPGQHSRRLLPRRQVEAPEGLSRLERLWRDAIGPPGRVLEQGTLGGLCREGGRHAQ